MADISMCHGEGCPLKETCFRFLAKADEFLQTYFATPYNPDKQECEYYWKWPEESKVE